jgi:hypothetical protein
MKKFQIPYAPGITKYLRDNLGDETLSYRKTYGFLDRIKELQTYFRSFGFVDLIIETRDIFYHDGKRQRKIGRVKTYHRSLRLFGDTCNTVSIYKGRKVNNGKISLFFRDRIEEGFYPMSHPCTPTGYPIFASSLPFQPPNP